MVELRKRADEASRAPTTLDDDQWKVVLGALEAAEERLQHAAAEGFKVARNVGDQALQRDLELLADEALDLYQQANGLKLRAKVEKQRRHAAR